MPDRIAFVTGGAGGIGSAACRALAAQGVRVAVTDLEAEPARALAKSLGAGHAGYALDVTDEKQVAEVFGDVEAKMGPVAILLCVAGGPFITPEYRPTIATMTLDYWAKTEALNLRGTFLAVREFLRAREKKPVPHGRIVAMASLAGQTGGSSQTDAAYGAAKAGVASLMRNAAVQGAPLGITANAVAPGLIDTQSVRDAVTPVQREAASAITPLKRLGEAAEVAEVIAFLVSPGSSFVTGQTISVNGGRFMA